MADTPILSVIIPTSGRAETLKSTLETALAQSSTDYEIVVSDNASEDGTQGLLTSVQDTRLRFFRAPQRLSMCDNYEFAVSYARGHSVLIIGDDDALIPRALDALLVRLRQQSALSIYSWPLHTYDWPSGFNPARIDYVAPEGQERVINLKPLARRTLQLGGWRYFDLPAPYHACVPNKILNAIKQRTGRIFHSTQPDVFTSMAIPAFVDTAIRLPRGVSFNGRSPRSNGAGFVNKAAATNIDKFIGEYGDYRFHRQLYDGVSKRAIMIPDAVLLASDMFPELYNGVQLNHAAMWAFMCRHGFTSAREILWSAKDINRVHPFSLTEFLGFLAVHKASGLRRQLLNRVDSLKASRHTAPGDIAVFAHSLVGTSAALSL